MMTMMVVMMVIKMMVVMIIIKMMMVVISQIKKYFWSI